MADRERLRNLVNDARRGRLSVGCTEAAKLPYLPHGLYPEMPSLRQGGSCRSRSFLQRRMPESRSAELAGRWLSDCRSSGRFRSLGGRDERAGQRC